MDSSLLALLRCPVSHQPLQLLAPEEARRLGLPAQPLLMRGDGRVYYRFEEHGFPLLLPGSGTDVAGADGHPVAVSSRGPMNLIVADPPPDPTPSE